MTGADRSSRACAVAPQAPQRLGSYARTGLAAKRLATQAADDAVASSARAKQLALKDRAPFGPGQARMLNLLSVAELQDLFRDGGPYLSKAAKLAMLEGAW